MLTVYREARFLVKLSCLSASQVPRRPVDGYINSVSQDFNCALIREWSLITGRGGGYKMGGGGTSEVLHLQKRSWKTI